MAEDGTNGVVAKLELVRACCALRLPAYETRTLIALASLINEKTGCAFPSRATLASVVNTDDRNLGRALQGLRRRGLLSTAKGDRGRVTEYRINVEAVFAARPVSTDGGDPSLQTGAPRLYTRVRPVSTHGETPSLHTGKEQLRASEAQAKQQSKLPASRSARSRSLEARAHAGARRQAEKETWRERYLRPAGAKPHPEAAE